jgi:hypothetical protein
MLDPAEQNVHRLVLASVNETARSLVQHAMATDYGGHSGPDGLPMSQQSKICYIISYCHPGGSAELRC